MNLVVEKLITQSLDWLRNDVFPLWSDYGIDKKNGGFVESLSFDGRNTFEPRRALVQARQIYSFTEAAKMGIISTEAAKKVVAGGLDFLLKHYLNKDGAFIFSVDEHGKPVQEQVELYTQAFVLFGLARAYELLQKADIKTTAINLLQYLNAQRKNKFGGYIEIKNGIHVYQSNPHMHLFESLIEWMRVDSDESWKTHAGEVYNLCKTKFIDTKTGFLAEHFIESWSPLIESNSFIFEPGHHYEWAWLFVQYEKLLNQLNFDSSIKLYWAAENYGVDLKTGFVRDEMKSDTEIKKDTSRFWPQCERIKIAVQLAALSPPMRNASFTAAADQAVQVLLKYLGTSKKGLWEDTWVPSSAQFVSHNVKSSSLYHIINAISEYAALRPKIKND